MMAAVARDPSQLRVALFSGNYNYVCDGANKALNRLVGHLLKRGAAVRVYSPTSDTPSFEPQGDLVSVPSLPLPFGRGEYRMAWPIPRKTRSDIEAFQPNVCHISLPMMLGSSALKLARQMGVPAIASMHTRFETYPRYYGLGFLEGPVTALLRQFYRGCDAVVAPCQSAADTMRMQGMADEISIWSRGIDRALFNPARRDPEWRRAHGIEDGDVVIGFLGRLVMEKGLDVFAGTIHELERRSIPHKLIMIGDGPARQWLAEQLPGAIFAGHCTGDSLAHAVASMDVLLNPSVTEAFGNVTLEAMASGVPVVGVASTGSSSIIKDGVTGRLIEGSNAALLADALQIYIDQPDTRQTHAHAAYRASHAYDWDSINDRMIEAYLTVLDKKAH